MKKRVQKTTKRPRQPPVHVREARAAARRFPNRSEEWYPDPFVPEHGAAVDQICADKRKHRSRTVAKNKRVVPKYICGGAGGKNWQRRGQAATVVRDNAMRWEGNLRSQLQLGLDLDIDVFTCDVAHLRQLQGRYRKKLTNEQSRFIDLIALLNEIREAFDSFSKAVDKIDEPDSVEMVMEEGAVLAAKLVSRSMSLASMAAEVVMDEELTKRKHSVKINRQNAKNNRKLTKELKKEVFARMDELCRTDLTTTDAAKKVADELKQKYSRPPGSRTIYQAYILKDRFRNFNGPFSLLLAASEGMNDNEDISTCKLLAMAPLEMAAWHLVGKHGNMSD